MQLPSLPPVLAKYFKGFRIQPEPHRDWLVVLTLFIVLLAVSVTWSSFFFLDVVSREPAHTQGIGENTADTSALQSVKEQAERRAQEAQRFGEEYRFVDPSR